MLGSTLPCERLLTDQAEAEVLIENAEDLANLFGACEHYRLNLIKHARLIRFVKHLPPAQCWHPQATPGNENCRPPLSSDGKRSPARFRASSRLASDSARSDGRQLPSVGLHRAAISRSGVLLASPCACPPFANNFVQVTLTSFHKLFPSS
jgi:hypothetical protein